MLNAWRQFLLIWVWFASWATGLTCASIDAENIDSFFVTPNTNETLSWRTDGVHPASYVVMDIAGRQIKSGTATPDAGRIQISLSLPQGYYELKFAETGETFGIVALPGFGRQPDPYFCIDSALAWLAKPDDFRAGFIRGYKRNGIAMSRERLSWRRIQPQSDRWNWQSSDKYESLYAMYAQQGIPVLQVFHDSPDWIGKNGKFPLDMVQSADAWSTILARYKGTWAALEVWNEPNITFGGRRPADQMVPLLHTISTTGSQDRIPLQIGGGVLSSLNFAYFDNAEQNGMLGSCDFYSFHTYAKGITVESQMTRVRDWMSAANSANKPIWITEAGWPWKRGSNRPPIEQDIECALDITMKAIEFRACGVQRYFPFVTPYYEENTKNFAMTGKEGTPLRSMAAYVTAIHMLAGLPYRGDVRLDDSNVVRARVFGNDEHMIVTIVTGKASSSTVIKCPLPVEEVRGIDGRLLERKNKNEIPVPDGLAYLAVTRASLAGKLNENTAAMRLYRLGADKQPAELRKKLKVIPQYLPDMSYCTSSAENYIVQPDKLSQFPICVQYANLSHTDTQTLSVTPFNSLGISLAEPVRLTLAPRSSQKANWVINLRSGLNTIGRGIVDIRSDTPEDLPPLKLSFVEERNMEASLDAYSNKKRLPINELDRWQTWSVDGATVKPSVLKSGGCQFELEFPNQNDPWVYPIFTLPNNIDMTGAKGLLIRVRAANPCTLRVFAHESAKAKYFTVDGINISDAQWRTLFIPFEFLELFIWQDGEDANGRLDLNLVRKISIGMKSRNISNSFEISDVYVIW